MFCSCYKPYHTATTPNTIERCHIIRVYYIEMFLVECYYSRRPLARSRVAIYIKENLYVKPDLIYVIRGAPQGGVWYYVLCAKLTCLLCAM